MTIRITAQIICDIIKDGMQLKDDQIWIYNQRWEIPEDKRLYVVVGLMSAVPYGNTFRFSSSDNTDQLYQYMKEMISVDLLSYTTEPQEKYAQILGSIMSTYSQQIQEAQAIKIYSSPMTINDVSHVEGPTRLNRISMTLQVLRKYDMLALTEYYDWITPGYIALAEK